MAARRRFADRAARALGAAPAGYAITTLVRPSVLARPAMLGSSGSVDVLVRAVGARDAASGLAIAIAPAGTPQRLALAVRVLSDLGDAVSFGTADLPAEARRKAVGVALVWGAVNALAFAAVR